MKLRQRFNSHERCAFCHEEGGELTQCGDCGTLCHEACLIEADLECPTLGCGGQQQEPLAEALAKACDVHDHRLLDLSGIQQLLGDIQEEFAETQQTRLRTLHIQQKVFLLILATTLVTCFATPILADILKLLFPPLH